MYWSAKASIAETLDIAPSITGENITTCTCIQGFLCFEFFLLYSARTPLEI